MEMGLPSARKITDKTEMFPHQKDIFDRSKDMRDFALFLEMGLGKTKIIIDQLAYSYMHDEITAALVIAPKGVIANWTMVEMPKHMTPDVNYDTYLWGGQTTQREEKLFAKFVGQKRDRLKVFVINYDALNQKRIRAVVDVFLKEYKSFALIADEATAVKTYSAQRSKHVYAYADRARLVRVLTGTPITQGPMDLWGICRPLGRRVFDQKSFYGFRNRYAITRRMKYGNQSFDEIVGYQNQDELREKVDTFSSVLQKDEVLDLPDKIYSRRAVPLTKTQRTMYDEMVGMSITSVGDETITAVNALGVLSKLQQICVGQMKTGVDEYAPIDNNRIEACLQACREAAGKVIVWCHFTGARNALCEALCNEFGASSIAVIHTTQSTKMRQVEVERFKTEESCRIFLSSPGMSGHGITLTEANTVIYYCNSFKLEDRLQSEDRCHRIGQASNVQYIDLVSPSTVDIKVLAALRKKINLAELMKNNPAKTLRDLL